MSLFLDYLWIWITLTFVVGICSGAWYINDQRGHNLIIAIASPILILTIGLTLYYGIETDRKSIIRMLDALIVAAEADDPETVCQFISPKAVDVWQLAKTNMCLVEISKARYHSLKIDVHDTASPPIANVRFTATFQWKNKSPLEGFTLTQPIPETVQFEIELVKTINQSWLITDKLQFSSRYFLHEII